MADLTYTQLAVIAMVAIALHIVLLLLSRKFNVIFLLTAAYCVLSPLSVAPQIALFRTAKFARVYVTLLTVALGIFVAKAYRFRSTGLMLLFFASYYALAGLYSDLPVSAIKYKGLYVLAVLSGLMLATSVRSISDLHLGMRVLSLTGVALGVLVLMEMIRNPAAISHIGRLVAFGINPNRLGQTASPLAIICVFVALYDTVKVFRMIAFPTAVLLAVIMLYTGCRGALGMFMIGSFIVALPILRRPFLLAVLGILIFVAYKIASSFVFLHADTAGRLTEVNFNTRESLWIYAWGEFLARPIFGHGWMYIITESGGATNNMHSMYIQTLIETGAVGGLIMFLALAFIALKGLAMRNTVIATSPQHNYLAYLSLGFVVSILAHGVVEAGTVVGATLNAVFLAFGVGLIDRVPVIVWNEQEQWVPALDYGDEGDAELAYGDESLAPT